MLDIIGDGIAYGMVRLYIGRSAPIFPFTDHTPTKQERNEEIRARHAAGKTVGKLGAAVRYFRAAS